MYDRYDQHGLETLRPLDSQDWATHHAWDFGHGYYVQSIAGAVVTCFQVLGS